MANGAPLPHRLVLINEGSALLGVTLEAGFIFAQERKPAGSERLLNICRRALDRDAFVQFMTIRAAHLAFEHRMMMRQLECRANFQVTLETGFRRLSWIYDGAGAPARFDVQTPGTVARLAAHVRDLLWSFAALCAALTHNDLFCLQSRVSGGSEIAHDLFVAGRAFL
jgi:hypothetical protein